MNDQQQFSMTVLQPATGEPDVVEPSTELARWGVSRDDLHVRGVWRNLSHRDDQHEVRTLNDYIIHMENLAATLRKYETPENAEQMAADFEKYRAGYVKKAQAYYSSLGRTVSQFITGSGGWTGAMVRRNEKRQNIAHERQGEWIRWYEKNRDRLLSKYDPKRIASAPIKATDDDAIPRLEAKIMRLSATQEKMKNANKIVRNRTMERADQITELVKLGLTTVEAEALFVPQFGNGKGPIGFASYALRNNNAAIKTAKDRLAALHREQAKREKQEETGALDDDGNLTRVYGDWTYCENQTEERLQLIYAHGRTDKDTYSLLRRHGFVFSPTNKAFHRTLNELSRIRATSFLRTIGVWSE